MSISSAAGKPSSVAEPPGGIAALVRLPIVFPPTLIAHDLDALLFVGMTSILLRRGATTVGNGGAWQTGVPATGNGAASDQKKSTNVTIEEEKLAIDLHQEFAAVEVRYRMKNTGAEVAQDFFFPVERWAPSDRGRSR